MTTTESQITSGKAESTIDTPEFVVLKNALIDAGVKSSISGSSIDVQLYLAAEDDFVEFFEAVREKDREEARKEEEEATDDWRRLALQFDGHRLQALGHLKAMLQDSTAHRANAEQFLAAGPLSGEVVLAERIAALAERDHWKAKAEENEAWRTALEDACTVAFMDWSDNPRETINKLIQWHCQIALDPRVSSTAAEMIEQGVLAGKMEAIAERQAPDLSKMKNAIENAAVGYGESLDPALAQEYAKAVLAILSPAQQEPATPPTITEQQAADAECLAWATNLKEALEHPCSKGCQINTTGDPQNDCGECPMEAVSVTEAAKCWCATCRPITPFGNPEDNRMVLCPTCGNKRCPHANDHRNACTNSNKPGQFATPAQATPEGGHTRLDIMSLIHSQCHRVYASAIDREDIDTKYMDEIEDAIRNLASSQQVAEPVSGYKLVVFDAPNDEGNPCQPFVIDDDRAKNFHKEPGFPASHLEPLYRAQQATELFAWFHEKHGFVLASAWCGKNPPADSCPLYRAAPPQQADHSLLLAEIDWCFEHGNAGPRVEHALVMAKAALLAQGNGDKDA